MKLKKGDIIITLGLVVLSFAMAFGVSKRSSEAVGQIIRVEVNGEVQHEVPLNKDQELIVDDGVHYNKIVIKDGKAYMDEANCPDQICTHMHEIDLDGETIICLPNRVFVEVVDTDKDDDGIDKINR